MEKDKKSNVAIWKIDTSLEDFSGKAAEAIIGLIRARYKKRPLDPVRLSRTTHEGKKVKAFGAKRFSEGLQDFLGSLLPSDLTEDEKQDLFFSVNKDIVLFIYDNKDVFAITSGSGYSIIQQFVDERFPFEVAKRMLRGDFKSAEMRDLTGLVYAQSRNFRRDYNFSRKEAFGKVWKKLSGAVDSSVVKASAHISSFIADKSEKKLNADVKSSFTFRKKVKIDQMFAAIKELQALLAQDLTDAQKRAFGFLDTLKQVTKKETKDALKDVLADMCLSFIRSSEQESDFDFCHPREMTRFLHGTGYEIAAGIEWDEAPSAAEVLVKLRESDGIDKSDAEKFKKDFLRLKMDFQEDEEGPTFGDDLWKYFHGEVEFGGKKYFLIDGQWYEVVGEFLTSLAADFIEDVFTGNPILTSDVPFMAWDTSDDEGVFNEKQGKKPGFYFGDKVFLKGEKGKIELFDLLYVVDDKVYIIQVKDGFGASIRDACSQIQMAAEIIERDMRMNDGHPELGRYHDALKEKHPGLSKDEFFKLLDRERHYILAVSTRQEFTKAAFENGKHKSDIAKFEVLGTSHEFRVADRPFHVAHIEKNNSA